MDDSFGHWLAGFIDGEGCFTARITKHGQIQIFMTIGLRADDRAILEECQRRTGLGVIYQKHSPSLQRWSPQAKWVVHRKSDCQKLVDLLRKYPLRAKKASDFAIWSQAVELHANRQAGDDITLLSHLMNKLKEGRRY